MDILLKSNSLIRKVPLAFQILKNWNYVEEVSTLIGLIAGEFVRYCPVFPD